MKILIIRFSALGDLVTFEPHCRAIKFCNKNFKIDFLTSNLGKSLYQDSEYFEDFIIYKTFFKTLKIINNNQYDLIINLQCNKLSHYLLLFSNANKKINLSSNIFQKILKLKHHTKTVEEMLIACDINKNIVENFIKKENSTKVQLPFLKKQVIINFKNKNKMIGISTGSSEKWTSKKWGLKNYKELISNLLKRNLNIVLIGTSLEEEDALSITSDFHDNLISYVNKTNISELKSLISKFDLFIGNDSGPAHIAAGLGINTITIFGSTSEKHCVKNLPYLGEHICMTPDNSVLCHPCYKSKCPTKMECMESIRAEVVFEKALELLKIQNN